MRDAQACGHPAQQIREMKRRREKIKKNNNNKTLVRCYCLWCKIELLKNSSSVYRLLCSFFAMCPVCRTRKRKTHKNCKRFSIFIHALDTNFLFSFTSLLLFLLLLAWMRSGRVWNWVERKAKKVYSKESEYKIYRLH